MLLFLLATTILWNVAASSKELVLLPAMAEEERTELLDSFQTPSQFHCASRCAGKNGACNVIDMTTSTEGDKKTCKLLRVDFRDEDMESQPTEGNIGHHVMRLSPKGLTHFFGFDVTAEGSRFKVVIHHDAEQRTEVNGYQVCNSYVRPVSYDGAMSTIRDVVSLASSCQQSFKLESKGVMIYLYYCGAWKSPDGETRRYFPSRDATEQCYCSRYDACCCGESSNCNADDSNANGKWVTDEGYFTKKSHLPVVEMSFGDTEGADEMAYHTLGPLECFI